MTQSLTEFFRVKKQRADEEDATVDWSARKAEWLEALRSLYAQVREILKTPLDQGAVQAATRPKELFEDHLGSYQTEELVLSVGDEHVVFSPKGRNVIGAAGRVDILGEAGEATLVLQPGPRWAVVRSKYPQLNLVEFNEVSLEETLRGVMRR
ncbi:MAG: hypothetical protein ACHRHE_02180 [Tepidisphaerales bacterium]